MKATAGLLALLLFPPILAATPCQSCKVDLKTATVSCAAGDGKRQGGNCKLDKDGCMVWGTCDKPILVSPVAVHGLLILSHSWGQTDSAPGDESAEAPVAGAPYTPAPYGRLPALHGQVIVSSEGFEPEDTMVTDGRVRIGYGLDLPAAVLPNHRELSIWNLTDGKELVFDGIIKAGVVVAIHVPGTDVDAVVEWRLLTGQEPAMQRGFLDGLSYADDSRRWRSVAPR